MNKLHGTLPNESYVLDHDTLGNERKKENDKRGISHI